MGFDGRWPTQMKGGSPFGIGVAPTECRIGAKLESEPRRRELLSHSLLGSGSAQRFPRRSTAFWDVSIPWVKAMRSLPSRAWKRLSCSKDDAHDGQALIEYSLIIVLIVLVCVTFVATMGDTVRDELWGMTSDLPFID